MIELARRLKDWAYEEMNELADAVDKIVMLEPPVETCDTDNVVLCVVTHVR